MYNIDIHPSTGGEHIGDIACWPFQIPLGALIPVRMENLIAGGKNIGTTHITNGAYRLHPIEWNVGEAAAHLVAFCLTRGTSPRTVRAHDEILGEFRRDLDRAGIERQWPTLFPY